MFRFDPGHPPIEHKPFVGGEDQGCQRHGEGNHGGGDAGLLSIEDLGPGGKAQQDEGELTALCQGNRDGRGISAVSPRNDPDAPHGQELQRNQTQCQRQDQHWGPRHQGEIQARPDGDEEQAEQQPPEGFDIGLKLTPELTLRQHHPGQKGTQGWRQTHRLHQGGHRHHQQQGRGGEDLAQPGGGDKAEQRPDQIAPTTDDAAHGRQTGQHPHPGR